MPATSNPKTVLILTDSNLTYKSINRLLKGQFEVLHVEDAEQAWELLLNNTGITVLLADIRLTIDNTALLERVRRSKDGSLQSLPVLLMVGESVEDEELDKSFALGATDFINTPFSTQELQARVRLNANLFIEANKPKEFDLIAQEKAQEQPGDLKQEDYFKSRLQQEISFSMRHKAYVSVCCIKVDNSELIVKQHGKKILLSIIRIVSNLIDRAVRREDIYSFLGNSSFALLFPTTNALGANVALTRILKDVQRTHFKHSGEEFPVTISMGLFSSIPKDSETSDSFMEVSEHRVDTAQKQGGNQIYSGKSDEEKNEMSLEQAINMISHDREQEIIGYIPSLLDTLLPLLDAVQEHKPDELDATLEKIGR